MKRKSLSFTVVALCALALAACGGGGGGGGSGTDTFTFASFGGATTTNVNDIYLKPFTSDRKMEVLNDSVDYGKLYSMVKSNNVSWDLIQGDGYFAKQACEDGVLEPLAPEVLEAAKKSGLPSSTYGKCYIEPWSYSWVLAYNTDEIKKAPTSWAALTDTDQYPGKRTLWSADQLGIPEAAELAAGTDPKKVYPIDYDTAFNELDKIKDDVIFNESLVDQAEDVASGKATMGILTSARALAVQKAGEPVGIRWDQQILTGDTYFVPKGAPNAKASMELLTKIVSDPDKLVEFGIKNGYGPNGSVAQDLLKQKQPDCKDITTCPNYVKTAIRLSDDWWFKNREEISKRWKEWVGA